MRRTIGWGAALVLAGVAVASSQAAYAGPAVPLVPASLPGDPSDVQLQVGGLDFWVASCSLTVAGTTSGCSGLQVAAGATSSSNAAVTIESATPGGHILDIPANEIPLGDNSYDLSVTLDVETVACANNSNNCAGVIKSDAVSLTGNVSPSLDDAFLTAGETITLADGTSLPPLSAAVGAPAQATFPGQPFVVVEKDIGDELNRITGSVSGPVTIDTVSQNFGLAPEPASIGVFLVSLAALGVARRRGIRFGRPS